MGLDYPKDASMQPTRAICLFSTLGLLAQFFDYLRPELWRLSTRDRMAAADNERRDGIYAHFATVDVPVANALLVFVAFQKPCYDSCVHSGVVSDVCKSFDVSDIAAFFEIG